MAFQSKCPRCRVVFTKPTRHGATSSMNAHRRCKHKMSALSGDKLGVKEVDAPLDESAKKAEIQKKSTSKSVQWEATLRQTDNGVEVEEWVPPTKQEYDELVGKVELLRDLCQRLMMEVV